MTGPALVPMTDPKTVVLNSIGNGSIFFPGIRPTVVLDVDKITVEVAATSSGTVAIYKDGTLYTAKALAPLMTAKGEGLQLYHGQTVEVRIVGGPSSTRVQATMHYREVPL